MKAMRISDELHADAEQEEETRADLPRKLATVYPFALASA
jgi:hypothetical protein